MSKLKYEIGDEVRLVGLKITDTDEEDSGDEQYLIETSNHKVEVWVSESEITRVGDDDSDDPIEPGDFIVRRAQPGRVGKVTAIKKGEAWIDWSPTDENTVANQACQLHTIRKLTEKELRQLAEVR